MRAYPALQAARRCVSSFVASRHSSTHAVENQSTPLVDYNAFTADRALADVMRVYAPDWGVEGTQKLTELGREVGSERYIEAGFLANKNTPVLHTHDRYGNRIDRVDFHPAYHDLMALGIRHGVHNLAWRHETLAGNHVARAATLYLLSQSESGVGCPMSMTYAGLPVLREQPTIAAEWEPRLLSTEYDKRYLPASEKKGAIIGMAMTEKQGGSDVRANTTQASATNEDGTYTLRGHKWFCSAPMSDAFLTLAHTPRGLSCFFVPRFRPDDSLNTMRIMRLKDKLGNRSNASSEIEYEDAWAQLVGPEGKGVRTIIQMVHHTRLDCLVGCAALMRFSTAHAIHHGQGRRAFGARLSEHSLMQNVLADLAVESEAAVWLMGRVARSFGRAASEHERAFSRIATPVAKYWICKRTPGVVGEALECHGGAGYVEDFPLARAYREAPLNGIWEGSGNVMCLDVLRALKTDSACAPALIAELNKARGADSRLDNVIDSVASTLSGAEPTRDLQYTARSLVEHIAIALQGAELCANAPEEVSRTWLATRLAPRLVSTGVYGTQPGAVGDDVAVIARAAVHQ